MANEEIIGQALKQHVTALATECGQRNLSHVDGMNLAAQYIQDTLTKLGYQVLRQEYKTKGVTCANLEAIRHGSDKADEIIVVGAHYDSITGSPGANDNGSGVAGALELARAFTRFQSRRTVRFVFFANEEPPFFNTDRMGSYVYAHRARQSGDNIILAVILETIGYYTDAPGSQLYPRFLKFMYPDRGNFVAFVSNLGSRHAVKQVHRLFRKHSTFPSHRIAAPAFVPGVALSDHSAFWLHGYRALMVTDTAVFRYPFYHSNKDTPDKLQYFPFAQVTLGLINAVAELANR